MVVVVVVVVGGMQANTVTVLSFEVKGRIISETLLLLGLTFLAGNKFSPETVMPICLPASRRFNDTGRLVTSVGMGITKFKQVRGPR